MNCKKCAYKTKETHKFCPNCAETIETKKEAEIKIEEIPETNKEADKQIKIITKIISIVLGIGALAVLLFVVYPNIKENLELKKQAEEALVAEQEALDQLRDKQLEDLVEQVTTLKNKPAQIRTVTVEAKDTIADIVKKWSPRVVYVECTWTYTNTGKVYARASGSATLIKIAGEGIKALTNKHVLLYKEEYSPSYCTVTLPGIKSYSIMAGDSPWSGARDIDQGSIKMPQDAILSGITAQPLYLCPNVDIGDKVIVMGYPGIGSETSITVTEGIVSGFDGDYYITSAKIDSGNSGGAAILVKDNCYLGIPSASVVGTMESLGRILKASLVLK